MTDRPRSDLERIGDRLEQVEAILSFEGAVSHRLSAARRLLGGFSITVLPTRDMRRRWVSVLETMLRLDREAATAAEVADLVRDIHSLRRAVRAHEADIGP